MADTKFELDDKRQGHPDSVAKRPTETLTRDNLAGVIQMGDDTKTKRTENQRINSELMWLQHLSRAVMLAFQPETFRVAQYSISLLERCAHKIVRDRIKTMPNPAKHGKCGC